MQIVRLLLAAYGVAGIILWLPFALISAATGGIAGTDVASFGFLFVFGGPVVTFCSYVWVVWRPGRPQRLLLWGLVGHLPMLYWVSHGGEELALLVLAGLLLIGMSLYFLFVRSLWGSTTSDAEAS